LNVCVPEIVYPWQDYQLASTAISAPLLGRSVRKRETTSSAHWGRGPGSDGVADESFSKFPYRTRRPMCTGDDGFERLLDPTAILIRDSE
jgi:hypothetical protein